MDESQLSLFKVIMDQKDIQIGNAESLFACLVTFDLYIVLKIFSFQFKWIRLWIVKNEGLAIETK